MSLCIYLEVFKHIMLSVTVCHRLVYALCTAVQVYHVDVRI